MREISPRNFGLLIAYLLPGFVTLWGLSLVSTDVRLWLLGVDASGPTIGGFLYMTMGTVAAGLTVDALRWAALEVLMATASIERPEWNDATLGKKLQAYLLLIEIHYRYHQFYANTFIAVAIAYGLWRAEVSTQSFGWVDGWFVVIEGVFLAGSRNALLQYYSRASKLLGSGKEVADDEWWNSSRRRQGRSGKGKERAKL